MWTQSNTVTVSPGGMVHVLVHAVGAQQHNVGFSLEVYDSGGTPVETDRGYLRSGSDDKTLYEIDYLPLGVYTVVVTVTTDGTTSNDSLRLRVEGPGVAGPAPSFRRARRP